MSDPSDPFAPPSKASRLAASAPSRVQTSLFGALRPHYATSGKVAWMLVRLGQPQHVEHAASMVSLGERGAPELRRLLLAVEASTASPRADAAWRELSMGIENMLVEMISDKEKASKA